MLACYDMIVLGVSADPKPQESALIRDGKCPMMESNTGRPRFANLFEMQGWMTGITPQQGEALVSQSLYTGWQCRITSPETPSGPMHHKGLVLPDFLS